MHAGEIFQISYPINTMYAGKTKRTGFTSQRKLHKKIEVNPILGIF